MKLRALVALPLVLATISCSAHPEPTTSSREEAMKLCGDKVDAELTDIDAERKKHQSDYARYQKMYDDDFSTFLDTFNHWIYFDSDYERTTILPGYCRPSPNKKFKGYWYVTGYIEYLTEPLNGFGEAKVEKTYATGSSFTWRQE